MIGVTEPSKSHEWPDLIDYESTEIELALVVHSTTLGGPLGIGDLLVNTSLFVSDQKIPLTTEIAFFSKPYINVHLEVIPSVLIKFQPGRIRVYDSRTFHMDERLSFRIRLDLIEDHRIVESVSSDSISRLASVGNWLMLPVDMHAISVVQNLSRASLDRMRLSIKLMEFDKSESVKSVLIDTIPLKSLHFGEAKAVGSTGEGQVALMNSANPTFAGIILDEALSLQKKQRFDLVKKTAFKVVVGGLVPDLEGGTVECMSIGTGFDLFQVPFGSSGAIAIVSKTVDTELTVCGYIDDAPPMSAITIRNKSGDLKGLYSVPLVRSDLVFPSESVTVSISPQSIPGERSFLVPYQDHPWLECPIAEYATTRIFVLIESALRLPTILTSTFVATRVVALTVPPILLSHSEVIALQEHEERNDCFSRLGTAMTVSREETRHPIWQQALELDVYQWIKSDWLYFMVYKAQSGHLECVAHACIPLGRISSSIGATNLALFDAKDRSQLASSILKVSFPKDPICWCDVIITQPTEQYNLIEGEVCLNIEVFTSKTEIEPVRTAHRWLPISSIYPLEIANCPPSGVLKLSLSLLNGKEIAKSKHRLSMYGNDSVSCGGYRFFITR